MRIPVAVCACATVVAFAAEKPSVWMGFDDETNLAADAVGSGGEMSTAGTVAFEPMGVRGGCAFFDGRSWFSATKVSDGVPRGADAYTVCAWIRVAEGGSPNGGWVSWGELPQGRGNSLRLNGLGSIHNYWNARDLTVRAPTVGDGRWHHVVATARKGRRVVYMDGLALASDDQTPNAGTGIFLVGKTMHDAAFRGWVDELKIWKRAFNEDEVFQLYKDELTRSALAQKADLPLPALSRRAIAASAEQVLRDGFTVTLKVDFDGVKGVEPLYEAGPLRLGFRMAGKDATLARYDAAHGNYLNFPMKDGSCPVIEATICAKGGRVGIPLGLLKRADGVHDVTVNLSPVHFSILVDGEMDDDMPTGGPHPVAWPEKARERILSARVKTVDFASPARGDALPAMPDRRAIEGSAQYWTPPSFNAWVGDVAVGVWKDRFHVFYLYDRRHHGSGGGVGRHYFAHLSSADLSHWEEHPLVTPIENWWECVGTGTPFAYNGKLCLAYGLHTERTTSADQWVQNHQDELPPEKRGDGNFTFADLPKWIPCGGTYAESEDGIHFRKTGVYITHDRNPTVFNRADGRLGIGTADGQLWVSTDGKPGHWAKDGACSPAGGDCPAPFVWGDREYLLQGFIWMASRPRGGAWENWTASGDDVYEGLGVPMVAPWMGDRRILVGWLNHVHGWGGWMVFRELVRFPDGKLGTKWLGETPPRGKVSTFEVADVSRPFVLRFAAQNGGEDVEFRIDPTATRAQFTFPKKGESGVRAKTAAEILAARPEEGRFAKFDLNGDFAWKCGPVAIGKIRGLDRPFAVKLAQYFDVKSNATIFDVEIAGTRTLVTRRAGRFAEPSCQ